MAPSATAGLLVQGDMMPFHHDGPFGNLDCPQGPPVSNDQSDLSRFAWSQVSNEKPSGQHKPANSIAFKGSDEGWVQRLRDGSRAEHDGHGHIVKVDHPDGSRYEYSGFDACGQPTVCKITDTKTGDWGQWRKESDNLWRSYHRNKPNYEVLRGNWTVDDKGMMHMHGVQDTTELPVTQGGHPHASKEQSAVKELPGSKQSSDNIGPPPGYHNLNGHLAPPVVAEARHLLSGEFGTETPFEYDGKRYLARVEHHYHPAGFKGGPTGWHKGVTVYEADTP